MRIHASLGRIGRLVRLVSRALAGVLVLILVLVAKDASLDAQAPPGHYIVSTDTALDTETGLVWQRGQVEAFPLGYADALARCQALSLGGFATGWRLPNIREMLSIVDEREPLGPMWDSTVFQSAQLSSYWTATNVAGDTANAWAFTFTPGVFMERVDKATLTALVRCVH